MAVDIILQSTDSIFSSSTKRDRLEGYILAGDISMFHFLNANNLRLTQHHRTH